MKYLKTYEEIDILDIDALINNLNNLEILKSNNKYTISIGDYIYEFSRLIVPISVDKMKEYKGDGYVYDFSIFKYVKNNNNKIYLKKIECYTIDKKYWDKVKSIYDMRKNVDKYNL